MWQHRQTEITVQKTDETQIPTIIDPSATKNYPSATGSINVGISGILQSQ